MKFIESWLQGLLITIISVCGKAMFTHVALWCPDGEHGNVEGFTMTNDKGFLDHMCEYERPKEPFKP